MSDGELWAIGIVTSDCAGLFISEQVVKNQLVTLKEYLINATSGTKMCVVMQLSPVAAEEAVESLTTACKLLLGSQAGGSAFVACLQESGNLGKTWSSGIEVNHGRAAYSQLVDIGGSKNFLGLLYESDKGHITFDVVV